MVCVVTASCKEGDIRLANGNVPSEGLVQVCLSGTWGSVCDDLWDNRDAQVVCRQLGFNSTSQSC